MYVRLVSFALGDITCNAGETYFKFVKYSGMYANEETFRIYDGNVLLYTSPTLVSSEPRTIEECLTSSTNNQYSLQLIDAYGDSWSSPAYLEIVGEYGNVFFNARFLAFSQSSGISFKARRAPASSNLRSDKEKAGL